MKKLLLLTYFFPPANFAGSYRVASFARYLHRFGWYPIVVTRQFKEGTATFHQLAEPVGEEVIYEKHEGYEVYRLPYRANLRDRLFHRYGDRKWVWLRKALSLVELVLQNFTTRVIPYRNLYTFSLELLRKDPEIRLVLASGNPYQLFHFCYRLHQKTGVPWVADYRDEWTTAPIKVTNSLVGRMVDILEQIAERKFLGNATDFITVSKAGLENIRNLTHLQGSVVLNGFEPAEMAKTVQANAATHFTIVFNGTLYPTQPVEFFIRPLLTWISSQPARPDLRCRFIGIQSAPEQAERVRELIKGYESFFELTGRVSKQEVLDAQHQAHLLLMIAHHQQKGIPSSKIFEYIGLGRPLLLCPSDEDILEQILSEYSLARICRTEEEVLNQIDHFYRLYQQGTFESSFQADPAFQLRYTREQQARHLSEQLLKVIS